MTKHTKLITLIIVTSVIILFTGFSLEDEEKLAAAARHATIVKAGNMSMGVNLLTAITERVAQALDQSFDIEIMIPTSPFLSF